MLSRACPDWLRSFWSPTAKSFGTLVGAIFIGFVERLNDVEPALLHSGFYQRRGACPLADVYFCAG